MRSAVDADRAVAAGPAAEDGRAPAGAPAGERRDRTDLPHGAPQTAPPPESGPRKDAHNPLQTRAAHGRPGSTRSPHSTPCTIRHRQRPEPTRPPNAETPAHGGQPPAFDRKAHTQRNTVGRCINKFKQSRAPPPATTRAANGRGPSRSMTATTALSRRDRSVPHRRRQLRRSSRRRQRRGRPAARSPLRDEYCGTSGEGPNGSTYPRHPATQHAIRPPIEPEHRTIPNSGAVHPARPGPPTCPPAVRGARTTPGRGAAVARARRVPAVDAGGRGAPAGGDRGTPTVASCAGRRPRRRTTVAAWGAVGSCAGRRPRRCRRPRRRDGRTRQGRHHGRPGWQRGPQGWCGWGPGSRPGRAWHRRRDGSSRWWPGGVDGRTPPARGAAPGPLRRAQPDGPSHPVTALGATGDCCGRCHQDRHRNRELHPHP